jgi:hypothetical protein
MGAPTVAFRQLESPKPRISASPQGLTAVVRFRVAWEDAFTFANDILGILDGAPWQWPASPNMRAYNADIEPVGIADDLANQTATVPAFGSSPGEFYSHGLVTVTFGSQSALTTMPFTDTVNIPPALQFDPANPIEMSSYSVEFNSEAIKLPGGSLSWSANKADGSAQTIPAGVSRPESGAAYWRCPTFNLNITMHNCLYVDQSIVASKLGYTNNATMLTICERETLLFDGLKTNRREMSDGIVILDVVLNYKWRSIGWNVAFGSDGNLYRYVMTDKVPPAVYPETDINPAAILPPPTRWKPYNLNGISGR